MPVMRKERERKSCLDIASVNGCDGSNIHASQKRRN